MHIDEPYITMVCIILLSGYCAAFKYIIEHLYKAGVIPRANSGKSTAQLQCKHTNMLHS